MTDLRAVAPVRALRDRVLSWPTWAVLLGFYLLTRVVVALAIQAAAVCCQNPAGVGTLDPGYLDMVGDLGRHLVPPDRRVGLPADAALRPGHGQGDLQRVGVLPALPDGAEAARWRGRPVPAGGDRGQRRRRCGVGAAGLAAAQRPGRGDACCTSGWRCWPACCGASTRRPPCCRSPTPRPSVWRSWPPSSACCCSGATCGAPCVVLLLGFTRAVAPPLAVVVPGAPRPALARPTGRGRQQAPLAGQRVSAVVLMAATGLVRGGVAARRGAGHREPARASS